MLQTPLSKALRTTRFHLSRLEQLGVTTVSDLLHYFPRTYTDQRGISQIKDLVPGQFGVTQGYIASISSGKSWKSRMALTTALINDDTAAIEAVWFNQRYLAQKLKKGQKVIVAGKVKFDAKKNRSVLQSPTIELVGKEQIHTARIVPIYHETDLGTAKKVPGKISSKWIREKLYALLPYTEYFEEFLPEEIKKTYGLISYSQAVREAHFPSSDEALQNAKDRLAFNELFLLQLAALHRKYLWRKMASGEKKEIPADWDLIKKFTSSLPWPLTNAQKKAIYEIIKDLEKPFPMSRLLEGDTGSGKTVVAAAALLQIINAGYQACVLAPTEILARQHLATFTKLLKPFDITPTLLVGSTPAADKKTITKQLKDGEISLIVGTHALIQEKIGFKKLGLAVIDEQHRFGVKQRETLKSFGTPHLLNLTATPIPRTLALVVYGDQDLSILDEMPPNRQKILTRIVPEEKRTEAYKWITEELEQGRQAFIIFPLIEESEMLEVKAATKEFDFLQNTVFPQFKVGLLHGQMPAKDKDATMQLFAKGKYHILVSTSVVEVGVDVPNATIMMIEGAERFGLAQLHQFRGRVGRGSEKSYCLLFPSSSTPPSPVSTQDPTLTNPGNALKRLEALVKYDSGFKLAEVDLQIRGPGEVYGTAQSGIPDLKMASFSDALTIKQSREAAEKIINEDPELTKYPKLKEKILEQQNIAIDY